VDVDRDGKLEVILGTSVGYVYVLDSRGNPLPNWPLQMGEVQAQARRHLIAGVAARVDCMFTTPCCQALPAAATQACMHPYACL
jgi:hypothetical protein